MQNVPPSTEMTVTSADGRTISARARQNDAGQWFAGISENGWEWEGNPEFFPTPEEALAWARRMIEETLQDDLRS